MLQVGSVVISHITSPMSTWSCLILLLSVHLAMNYAAVRAVRMQTLNRQRANIVLSRLWESGQILSPKEVCEQERIFEYDGVLRWNDGPVLAMAEIGASFHTLANAIGRTHGTTGSIVFLSNNLSRLMDVFQQEEYILWYDRGQAVVSIGLKDGVSTASQLKAWGHSLLISHRHRSTGATGRAKSDAEEPLPILATTLHELSFRWERDMTSLRQAGWDLDSASLETTSSTRLRLHPRSISKE